VINKKKKCFIALLILFIVLVLFSVLVHPFLALKSPVNGNILVVEGWFYGDNNALHEAIDVFNNAEYRYIVTVGGPSSKDGKVCMAEMAAQNLVKMGMAHEVIVSIL